MLLRHSVWLLASVLTLGAAARSAEAQTPSAAEALKKGGQLFEAGPKGARVRLLPHDKSRVVRRVRARKPLVVVKRRPDGWNEAITERGRKGWVHVSELRPPGKPDGKVEPPTSQPQRIWYVFAGGAERGPMSASDLCRRLHDGTVSATSRVAKKGFKAWHPLRTIRTVVATCKRESPPAHAGWFVLLPSGKRRGPLTTIEICNELAGRRATKQSHVARDGDTVWRRIEQVPAITRCCGHAAATGASRSATTGGAARRGR